MVLPMAAVAGADAKSEQDNNKFQGYSKTTRSYAHYEINADATFTETVEFTIKVLDKKGVDDANRQSISYSNSLSDVKFIEAYTTKKDGKRIDVPKNNFQVQTNDGENGADPFISDIKTKIVIFPDVDEGDSVTLKYSLLQKEALFPKQFSMSETYSDSYIIEDLSTSISAPESLPIRVEARGIEGGEQPKKNGKRQWKWTYKNLHIEKPDTISVSRFDFAPRLVVSTFKDYAELANAYEGRARPNAVVSERIKKLAEEIAGKAKDPRETAQLLYEWVSKNIAYEANSIGVGSVVPHGLDHILDNKLGDCKDHTAMLQALLQARGIESSPALINLGGAYTLPELPSLAQLNHIITYVPSLDLFMDSTADDVPFGTLPGAEYFKPVVLTTNFKEIKRTPPSDNEKEWGKMHADITFTKDGAADVVLKANMGGRNSIGAHAFFKHVEMTQYKDELVAKAIKGAGFTGKGAYVRYDEPEGKSEPYSYEVKFHVDNAVNVPGPMGIGIQPFIAYHHVPLWKELGSLQLTEKQKHDFPCSGGYVLEEYDYHFPPELQLLAAPKDQHLTGKYGQYDATYVRDGQSLKVRRELKDNTPSGVCKPEMVDLFKEFDQKVEKDLKAQIIIQ